MAGRIDGIALGAMAAGGALVYAGIKGKSVPSLITGFVQGKPPANAAKANQITGTGDSGGTAGSSGGGAADIPSGSGQQALQAAAAQHGWGSGQQWQALQSVEMAEAGFNPTIVNQSSGALGLAQALGHGNANTAGTLGNQYGGFGLSDAQAKAANSGDAGAQAVWMCNYIAATYGNPVNAWAHEQANHWY